MKYLSNINGCSHIFCLKCIEKWAKIKNFCPNCRVKFNEIKNGLNIISVPDIIEENSSFNSDFLNSPGFL